MPYKTIKDALPPIVVENLSFFSSNNNTSKPYFHQDLPNKTFFTLEKIFFFNMHLPEIFLARPWQPCNTIFLVVKQFLNHLTPLNANTVLKRILNTSYRNWEIYFALDLWRAIVAQVSTWYNSLHFCVSDLFPFLNSYLQIPRWYLFQKLPTIEKWWLISCGMSCKLILFFYMLRLPFSLCRIGECLEACLRYLLIISRELFLKFFSF